MPILTVDGEPFHVALDGREDAPPLIVSNSLSSDLSMWDDQVAAWAKRFRVVRYDGRGQGPSVVSPGPYTMERLGRDAIAILDALGIARAHWCGLSMGGMVGMWALTHAPDRIDRAVLANTAAHMGPRDLWDSRIALAEAGGMEATVEPTITRWFPESFRDAAPDAMARMRAMVRRTPLTGYAACCAAIRDVDQRETIRTITRPTLVIIGANDPATKPANGEHIHAAIRGSRKLVLDAAHISNVERPEAFTQAVEDFLSAS